VCGPIAAWTEFQAKRGSVKTSSAHRNVTANARSVRGGRKGMRQPNLTRGTGKRKAASGSATQFDKGQAGR